MKRRAKRAVRRVDVQVSAFTAVIVFVSCFSVFLYLNHETYAMTIDAITRRVRAIHRYVEDSIAPATFTEIDAPADMRKDAYLKTQAVLRQAREVTDVMYLYTAKRGLSGKCVYVVDGLDAESGDFRRPGDAIEPEIVPSMNLALAGNEVLPDDIVPTQWGKIFIAYFPIHAQGEVVGVLGVEVEANAEYDTFRVLRIATPVIAAAFCLLASALALAAFRRISNPNYRDLSNTDYLTGLKNRNAFEVDLNNFAVGKRLGGFGISVIDLNNLKRVNDCLGHEYGDNYLRKAAESLKAAAGPQDVLYRIGGDEFAVVSPQADAQTLMALERQIEAVFARERPDWPQADLSLSMGHALFDPALDDNLFALYNRADQLMCGRKRAYHEERNGEGGR